MKPGYRRSSLWSYLIKLFLSLPTGLETSVFQGVWDPGGATSKSIEKQLQATWLCAEGLQLPQKNLMHQTLRTALSPAFTRSDCTLAWFWNVKRFGFVKNPLRVFHSYYAATLDVFITASSTWDFGLIGFFSKCSIPVKDSFVHCADESLSPQVFLKSDDLCLMGGEHARRRPTLPSVHILAMHVQQLEIGAFTLTTGAYKWTKLRWGGSQLIWRSLKLLWILFLQPPLFSLAFTPRYIKKIIEFNSRPTIV